MGRVVSPSKIELLYDVTRVLLQRDDNPTTELNFANPYTLLIAVLLSAQTTDRQVNVATAPLFAIADTPGKMLAIGDELLEYTKSLNYYKTKSRNVLKTSQMLLDMGYSDGSVPTVLKELTSLAGVGVKTAMVVLNVALGEPYIPVDTHVHRILNRLGILQTKDPKETSAVINGIPDVDGLKYKVHHALILHARYVCKAVKPLCGECVICDKCNFVGKVGL